VIYKKKQSETERSRKLSGRRRAFESAGCVAWFRQGSGQDQDVCLLFSLTGDVCLLFSLTPVSMVPVGNPGSMAGHK
jgi:hypothetical protein